MKKSKQAEASKHKDGVNLLSNLPDHVLLSILSHIRSTEELIRTSILSRQWRYLWTSIPTIDIDFSRQLVPEDLDSDRFKEFVDWVILNKPLNLDSFRLWCADYFNMSTINEWIDVAVMRKVKLLDLMFSPMEESEVIELPHCLVTCGSLEVLRLYLMDCPLSLPKLTGFPALRVLELSEVRLFDDNMLKYFLESCPLLEDLSLIDCSADSIIISCPKLKSLRIDNRQSVDDEEEDDDGLAWRMCFKVEICCPNLEFLSLIGYVGMEVLFEDLDSLKKAVLYPQDLFTYDDATIYVFDEISNVEYLNISLYCVGQCYYPGLEDPISLPNLKTLELTVALDALHNLVPFLKCVPDIESLYLIFVEDVYGTEGWWKLEEPETISILTSHLKLVEFSEFEEEKAKLGLVRALLEHGNELEEIVFSWGSFQGRFNERTNETMNKVSSLIEPSSNIRHRAVVDPSRVIPMPRQAYFTESNDFDYQDLITQTGFRPSTIC